MFVIRLLIFLALLSATVLAKQVQIVDDGKSVEDIHSPAVLAKSLPNPKQLNTTDDSSENESNSRKTNPWLATRAVLKLRHLLTQRRESENGDRETPQFAALRSAGVHGVHGGGGGRGAAGGAGRSAVAAGGGVGHGARGGIGGKVGAEASRAKANGDGDAGAHMKAGKEAAVLSARTAVGSAGKAEGESETGGAAGSGAKGEGSCGAAGGWNSKIFGCSRK